MKRNLLNNDWYNYLSGEFEKPYYLQLRNILHKEYQEQIIYPHREHLFHALHMTSFENTKVVIIGQDPYHGPGQAHGLSFSVQPGVKIPPSLQNIYQELHTDVGCPIPQHGYLQKWAEAGVLLLNSVLTVRANEPQSHKGIGWEKFTDEVIRSLNSREKPVVFFLWGKPAQVKGRLLTNSHHFVVKSPHPSPLSAYRGFFGSSPFSKANHYLKSVGEKEIDWELPLHWN